MNADTYIPRRLDDQWKLGFWDLDVALPFTAGLLLGYLSGTKLSFAVCVVSGWFTSRWIARIKADKHPAFAIHWLYWHLPMQRSEAWPRMTSVLLGIAASTLSAPAAHALQTIDARDGVAVEAILSIKEPTRIRIDGAPIVDVVGNVQAGNCGPAGSSQQAGVPLAPPLPSATAEVVVECDRDKGEIYVRPLGTSSKPVNRRKILFIDELKQQLGDIGADDPVKAAVVEEAARRARKYGGSLGTATQSADDYYGSKQMEAAFNCSDWVFLLRQKPESIEMLDRAGRLSMDEPKKRLLNSLRTEPGVFSEVYISSPVGEGVARNILDPATHLLFSNKLEDNAPIDALRAQGLSIDDAITELLRQRGPAWWTRHHARGHP